MSNTDSNWTRWSDLDQSKRRFLIADDGFWTKLSAAQRQSFLREAEWQDLRLVPEARQEKLESLVSLQEICSHLSLNDVEVYWMMSTRKLPGWLVEGVWKFDKAQVDAWVEKMGGKSAVKADVTAQIEEHRAGG
ncbi:MAG: helix-turn-helix domain-containing protein [Deltaproteobacteria bacterium]|nr:helix-turn-helix domain-containing protein [Deltaproteobacteria bacterium]